ncbi:IclR family transcriptional regulator [Maridesulfovibrio bastinii]|jgi:DNA-binding IclR family transcriptional regulator|uniref:IclR family transcriptional regulator n=1 Tax=Maridesulfovibrio bastinii TaxID=47157 RepID=UPI00040F2B52|nr:IclR family transcriptional regulator [Maridesulfovibrio bastinii]
MSEGRIIQSVARALNILELFERSSSDLSVTEIANKLDLSKSTAYGLISTLAHKGYLEQNPRDSRYSLGLKLLRLGGAVQRHSLIVRKAQRYMEKLVQEFSETVHLTVERNGMVVYIAKIHGEKAIFMQSAVGAENPMYCTAVGKCLLAFMDESKRERILRQMGPLERRGPNTITDMDEMRKELKSISEKGISIDDEEHVPGLMCIAAPVRNYDGEVIAAISISGAKAGISSKMLATISERITQIAQQISSEL